jgi:hypothetical protein
MTTKNTSFSIDILHKAYLDAIKPNSDVEDEKNRILSNMLTIRDETNRIIDIAHNSSIILDNLDAEFEKKTSLNSLDTKFLFLATALQCARQYIISNDRFRLTSLEGDKLVKNIVPKKYEDILLSSVPYDAVRKKDPDLDTDLGGTTHRYRTLGHDPVLGWIFGPMNILSDSLTKSDFITSYTIKNMIICDQIPTMNVFNTAYGQISNDFYTLPIAILRQALHFGSDYFTKYGLPVPVIGSIDNEISKILVTKFNIDVFSVTRGFILSSLINFIISSIHRLFYEKKETGDELLFTVRTRKIIKYSNIIASSSNFIYVTIKSFFGDTKSFVKFDLGGLIVTLHRIFTDIKFIGELKREFIMNRFNEMIRGKEYDF